MTRREGKRVATVDFEVTFEGPAVVDGRMPVRDLAPSLLSLGELLDIAKREVEPDLPGIGLEVQAFLPGSFHNLLSVAFDSSVALLVSNPTAAVTNLLSLVTHGRSGLLAVARALGGRQLVELAPADQSDHSLGKNNVGQQIVAPNSVFNMYVDDRSFELFSTFFGPLRKPGYDQVSITNPHEPFVASKADIRDMPEEPDPPDLIEGVEIGRR